MKKLNALAALLGLVAATSCFATQSFFAFVWNEEDCSAEVFLTVASGSSVNEWQLLVDDIDDKDPDVHFINGSYAQSGWSHLNSVITEGENGTCDSVILADGYVSGSGITGPNTVKIATLNYVIDDIDDKDGDLGIIGVNCGSVTSYTEYNNTALSVSLGGTRITESCNCCSLSAPQAWLDFGILPEIVATVFTD